MMIERKEDKEQEGVLEKRKKDQTNEQTQEAREGEREI